MRVLLVVMGVMLAFGGCNKDDKSKDDEPTQRRGEEGPGGDRDGPGEEGEGPWPPPNGEKATPPPAVKALMSNLVNAYNKKDAAAVQKYFINRTTFLVVSDCDPADVVDRVMDGARQAGERAAADGGEVTFKGFVDGEGYLWDVKKGDKPAECRAKEAVQIYMTKYDWTVGARAERGEAHFLRFNGVWFFVKL